jgi:6-pyruvoyltetrahydropterin/6-carboxytetrahydropterin synthase
MVIDFTVLKDIVRAHIVTRLDHALLLENSSGYLTDLIVLEPGGKIEGVDYTPTCENMLADMAYILKNVLPRGVHLHHLRLSETTSSFAEWYAEDNKH